MGADVSRLVSGGSLAEVQSLFAKSYAETISEIKQMSDDDLNQTGRFVWTGKGTLGGSITANTWRHYRWARTLIVKWRRMQKAALAKTRIIRPSHEPQS